MNENAKQIAALVSKRVESQRTCIYGCSDTLFALRRMDASIEEFSDAAEALGGGLEYTACKVRAAVGCFRVILGWNGVERNKLTQRALDALESIAKGAQYAREKGVR